MDHELTMRLIAKSRVQPAFEKGAKGSVTGCQARDETGQWTVLTARLWILFGSSSITVQSRRRIQRRVPRSTGSSLKLGRYLANSRSESLQARKVSDKGLPCVVLVYANTLVRRALLQSSIDRACLS